MERFSAMEVRYAAAAMARSAIEALVERALAREPGAWHQLWQAVEPRLYALIRRPSFLGRLSQSEDDCRNIVLEVLAALQADDHARLRRFTEARARNPALPFFAWLTVVAKRLSIDYMRRQDDFRDLRRHPKDGAKGAWSPTVALPSDSQLPGTRPQVTNLAAVRELLEFAGRDLPDEQQGALAAWIEGERFDDIARALGLADGRAAERAVRAAIERLRRRFRDGGVS
jgi:DNA-directed RNA polymerase specialized sigma24 family protein